jgi:enamine deaminase RidA (YjgF/YER057c/UK114 family)
MSQTNRRKFLSGGAAAAAATATGAKAQTSPTKRVIYGNGKKPEKTPMFSSTVAYGNLLFIAGVGYHKDGDIKVHTAGVLDEIQKRLEAAGSSMSKVLKVNVYLADLKDYDLMNEVYLGKFGDDPPVRTTIAAAGVPGNSKVEIDVIAYV